MSPGLPDESRPDRREGRTEGGKKEGEKIQRELSELPTKRRQMALDKSICFNPAKNIYIQSGVHALPGKAKGRISSPLSDRYCGFLLPLHIKSKNRGKGLKSNPLKSDTGRYYPACHSHPSGLLCVCPACTPRARGKGSVAPCHTALVWVAFCLKSPSMRHLLAKFLLREQNPASPTAPHPQPELLLSMISTTDTK